MTNSKSVKLCAASQPPHQHLLQTIAPPSSIKIMLRFITGTATFSSTACRAGLYSRGLREKRLVQFLQGTVECFKFKKWVTETIESPWWHAEQGEPPSALRQRVPILNKPTAAQGKKLQANRATAIGKWRRKNGCTSRSLHHARRGAKPAKDLGKT